MGRVERGPGLRHSPAGVPIARFTLEHRSTRTEGGMDRQVTCRIEVVAVGEALAGAAAALPAGAAVRAEGFLARAGHGRGETRIALHAEAIARLED